jgi:hypothetical protein
MHFAENGGLPHTAHKKEESNETLPKDISL